MEWLCTGSGMVAAWLWTVCGFCCVMVVECLCNGVGWLWNGCVLVVEWCGLVV